MTVQQMIDQLQTLVKENPKLKDAKILKEYEGCEDDDAQEITDITIGYFWNFSRFLRDKEDMECYECEDEDFNSILIS